MALNPATLSARGLRDPSKCACLLRKLLNLSVQCKRLTSLALWTVGCWRMTMSSFQNTEAIAALGVFLLIGRSLNADVNIILADDEGRLVVTDVAVENFEFQMVTVYAPNIAAERVSFNRRLAPFLDDPKRIVFVGDWNAILNPKIDWVVRGSRGPGRCESSLIDFMARCELVDRFRQDHPERNMWMWLDSSPTVRSRSYLDRVLVRRADTDFVTYPTFHYVGQTGHRLVRASLQLANMPSLAGSSIPPYWRYGTSGTG